MQKDRFKWVNLKMMPEVLINLGKIARRLFYPLFVSGDRVYAFQNGMG